LQDEAAATRNSRRAPSVFALRFGIIALTAAATWLVPAGVHAKLSYDGATAQFVVRDGESERRYAPTQVTLDEPGIRTPLASLVDGPATRLLPVPGSYRRIDPNRAGPLAIVTASIAGMVDAPDVIRLLSAAGAGVPRCGG